jgi:AraC-like DNA-binding protein
VKKILNLDDFDERAKDVSDYLCFLRDLEQGQILLSKNGKISKIDSELDKSLKATGFLLLYNLIESTMRNAIQSIFDEINTQGVSFDKLRIELKRIILQNVRKRDVDKVLEEITIISLDMTKYGFSRDDLFSGNVDAREIKEIAKKYGFSSNTDRDTRDGIDLVSIKKNRNDLAHGFMSFKEVGKNTSAENLVEISERVIKYLRQILGNIDEYLVKQQYLDSK